MFLSLRLEGEGKLRCKYSKGLRTHALFIIFITYISTGNFSSPIVLSDWLVFYCGNLMLQQKKKMKL